MDPIGAVPQSADAPDATDEPVIVWETVAERSNTAAAHRRHRPPEAAPGVQPAAFDNRARATSQRPRRRLGRLAAILTNPTFLQLHGRSPMETTRIATTSVADAADVLGRSDEVEWGRGRAAGQLLLGPFRIAGKELGRPHIADGTLHAHGVRRLRVTVAIYRYGQERCGIQIRPRYRRPRTARRLRHCLQSTHGAADRLRDLVLTVDFMPPRAVTEISRTA